MKKLILVLTLLTLAAVPVSAQTYLTTTTLTAAITTPSSSAPAGTTINISSATTAAVGGQVYIDHEVMGITAINGTILTVTRGQQGTAATTHNSGAVVIIAPVAALRGNFPGGVFTQLTPSGLSGSCTASNYQYLPIVDVSTGNVYLCWAQGSSGPNAGRLWHATNTVSVNGVYSLLLNLQ
jgi:hypothetical protein